MKLKQLFPAPPSGTDELSLSQVYTVPELAFPQEGVTVGTGKRPYLFFNMVSSVDGRAVTSNGNAEGLGSDTDRQLMYRLRAGADAVLCGASTFRRDEFLPAVKPWLTTERDLYFPGLPQPYGCVISRDGNLPLNKKFFRSDPEHRVVFLGEKASEEQEKILAEHAKIFRLSDGPDEQPDLVKMLEILYLELGVQRLLVEGGPTLNYSLLIQGLADELFWTLAPKIAGGQDNLPIVAGQGSGLPYQGLIQLELISLYYLDNELFFRYKIRPLPGSEATVDSQA